MLSVNKCKMIGHRGAAGLAPENTLAAFARAWEIGVDAVELDVHLSADGKVVVHHDTRLNPGTARSANGAWLTGPAGPAIKTLTLSELKTYDVGRLNPLHIYSRHYPEQIPVDGQRIPTLLEVIRTYRTMVKRPSQFWIEIKSSPEEPELTASTDEIVAAVAHVLREEHVADRALMLSFDWRSLLYTQNIAPEIPTVYLSRHGENLNQAIPEPCCPSPWTAGLDINDYKGSVPGLIRAAGGWAWAPEHTYLNRERVQEAHRLGLKVFAWTPDDRLSMRRLIKMNVDGIISNRPDILKSLLDGSYLGEKTAVSV